MHTHTNPKKQINKKKHYCIHKACVISLVYICIYIYIYIYKWETVTYFRNPWLKKCVNYNSNTMYNLNFVCTQNHLYCNNGLTIYLYVGVVLSPTNRGPKQVIVLPLNSLEYPNVVTHSLSPQCPTPSTLALTSFYSPLLVGWLSFPSPLTHTFPCPLESQGILTNWEDSLGTCSKRQTVFESGSLLK